MADAENRSGLLQVRLVTPDQVLLDTTATAVELPAMTGYLEALYGAAPLLAELGAGEVRLSGGASGEGGGQQTFFVAWGFVEVLPERVTILAEQALRPSEIDVDAAHGEERHAQELWNAAGDDGAKYDEANAVSRVAEEKLASAAHKG